VIARWAGVAGCVFITVTLEFEGRIGGEYLRCGITAGCTPIRGADELRIRGLLIAGLGRTRGATAGFVTPRDFGAGALRVVVTRGAAVRTVPLVTCPETLWIAGRMTAIEQNIKNRFCFISLSAN
jgi:hypothetical protein